MATLTLHVRINHCSTKKLTCARAVVLPPLMCCIPAPWQTCVQFPLWPSSADTTARLWWTSASSNQDGQVPPHQPPLHQGQVCKWSLSRAERLFSDIRRCRPVFLDPCSSFLYTSVNQEPIYWSQQVYLSVNAEAIRKQHQPSRTGRPLYLGLNLKAFWDMPCCLQWAFDQTSVHICSSTKFENSCKNADYILLKCYLTDFPLLYVTFNAYQMLLKHCMQLHNSKNQEWSDCYIQLKSQFLEAIFIFYHIYDGAITFFIFILSSIAHASLGHARKKKLWIA